MSERESEVEIRDVASIKCDSVITSLLYCQGKLFVGLSNKEIKVLFSNTHNLFLLIRDFNIKIKDMLGSKEFSRLCLDNLHKPQLCVTIYNQTKIIAAAACSLKWSLSHGTNIQVYSGIYCFYMKTEYLQNEFFLIIIIQFIWLSLLHLKLLQLIIKTIFLNNIILSFTRCFTWIFDGCAYDESFPGAPHCVS